MSTINNNKSSTSSHENLTIATECNLVFNEARHFNKKMYEFFKEDKFPEELEVYFIWKFKRHDISVIKEKKAYQMRNIVKDLLEFYYDNHPEAFANVEFYHYDPRNYDIEESIWCTYKGFKGDMYMVSFLEKIDEELTELIASGILQ